MNVFVFRRHVKDAIVMMQAARSLLPFAQRSRDNDVYVRLKDGTELPVTGVKVRGADRIILETFVE